MKQHLLHVLLVLCCGALSMGIWDLEFSAQALQGQLEWLGMVQYSVFLIAALAVVAYLHPFFRWGDIPAKSIWWAGVELYATLVTAILVSRLILFSLFTHFYGLLNAYSLMGLLLFLTGLTAYSFYSITYRRLSQPRPIFIILLSAGLVIALPLSWLSLKLLAWPAGKGPIDLWSAFSVGYPFFWLCAVFGALGWLTIHRFKVKSGETLNAEILDDGI